MLWLLYLAIGVSILAMRGHATEIWCIFGDKYVRCTLISVAAKGDQSISCHPRFLLHGNILCRGRFLPMDIMKRCLQGITLNLTSLYSKIESVPSKYLAYICCLWLREAPHFHCGFYISIYICFWTLRCKVSRGQLSIVQFSLTTDVGAQ